MNNKYQRCVRCICDTSIEGVTFNEDGVCNYCGVHDELEAQYPKGKEGWKELTRIADKIKKAGKGKKYDCVIGISGGSDSSYLLHLSKMLGLRPVAVHFDNGWNSKIAEHNMKTMTTTLQIPLERICVDEEEYTDIYRSFFEASLPDLEACTDIGLTTAIYMVAEKYGIGYSFDGHSYQTEGMCPITWSYMDAKYIKDVHDKHGVVQMKTFPNLYLSKWLKWLIFNNIKRIRPLYYMMYNNNEVRKLLAKEYGWKWYGGNHLESEITAFFGSVYRPQKVGIDSRMIEFSALVRSGQMKRKEAINKFEKNKPQITPNLLKKVYTKLGYTKKEFDAIMKRPLADRNNYASYKPEFKKLKPLFWLLLKTNRIAKTFYIKYVKG